jgi:pimeloyl-ACP methyl ester carboxylesterase
MSKCMDGWTLSSAEWFYAKQHLADRYQLLVWDLPGLGQSKEAQQHDRNLTHLAGDLEAVLSLVGDRQVLLCGHSIGGMITLTFCRLFPERLVQQVAGLVLTHTTYLNPVNTARGARVFRPLQNLLLRPLCTLTIALSPLMSLMNWLSELHGMAHVVNHFVQFGQQETRGQLRFFTALGQRANPAVVSRGMLAMMAYQAVDVVPNLPVPVLVVAAGADKLTVPEASRWIAGHAPQAQEVVLTGAGHLGLIEQHEVWAKAVDQFAQTCFKERA